MDSRMFPTTSIGNFRLALTARQSDASDMTPDFQSAVAERLSQLDINAFEAARRGGLERNFVKDIVDGRKRSVRGDNLAKLAKALGCDGSALAAGRIVPLAPYARIIGRVGADSSGQIAYADADASYDTAPLPPGASGNVYVLEVTGHSMRGLADDGSLIYFEDQRTAPSEDMLGHVVVAEVQGGLVMVKRLLRGSRKGLYDLESINGPTLSDQVIVWVAHVTDIVPPWRAARIIRRAGEEAA